MALRYTTRSTPSFISLINQTKYGQRFETTHTGHSGQSGGILKESMCPTLPSFKESMRTSNRLWNLGMKEGEYTEYYQVSNPVFEALKRVDDLYNDFEHNIFPEYSNPTSGNRKYWKPGYNNAKNPYNAWQCQCEISNNTNNIENSILKGKRIVLKDTVNIAQLPLENGSKMFGTNTQDSYISRMDASIVSRILDNGGVIVGKSTCEDLCYSGGSHTSKPHPVKNPNDTECHAGGSSSGTAALVATKGRVIDNDADNGWDVDIGISGDQGGSIRIPATWCGVFGFKPSWGLVPYTGIAQIAGHFDHVGPCANNMTDLCDLLTCIAGKDGIDIRQLHAPDYQTDKTDFRSISDELDTTKPITIGILTEGFSVPSMDNSVATCIRDNLDLLFKNSEGLINEIKEVSIPIHSDMSAIWCAIGYESQYTTMYQYGTNGINFKNRCDPYLNQFWKDSMNSSKNISHYISHTNKQNMMIGQYLLNRTKMSSFGEYFVKGSLLADYSYKMYEKVMNDNNIDVLIMPTLPTLSQERPDVMDEVHHYLEGINNHISEKSVGEMIQHSLSMIANTAPFNVTGSPALTVPFKVKNERSRNGGKLFAGMQIIGRNGDDKTVLKTGHVIEKVLMQ